MPMYYFDLTGPGGDRCDDAGHECSDLDQARRRASDAVCAAAGEHRGEEDWFAYTVRVRDMTGALVCAATFTSARSQADTATLLGEVAA